MPDHTGPTVVIVESHVWLADVLHDVVILAGGVPLTVGDVESVRELRARPAAMVVRIVTETPVISAHVSLAQFAGADRPFIVALTSTDADVAEAERLQCEVIAHAPHQVRGLYDALIKLAGGTAPASAPGTAEPGL